MEINSNIKAFFKALSSIGWKGWAIVIGVLVLFLLWKFKDKLLGTSETIEEHIPSLSYESLDFLYK